MNATESKAPASEAKKTVAPDSKYKVLSPIYVGTKRYAADEEVELTADQAKRLDGKVEVAATK